jgi:endonuclease/exonuclease/phosphatase family metal-dependent hydrolase
MSAGAESFKKIRIVAWNVNHRGRRMTLRAGISEGILSLAPDVVVLTEYVLGRDHEALCGALNAGGLSTQLRTEFLDEGNQVLVASRPTASREAITPPESLEFASSNCLCVRISDPAFNLLGLRVPFPSRKLVSNTRAYWDWLEAAIQRFLAEPSVVIGDLNVDPRHLERPGAQHLSRLRGAGWQMPDPIGPWSYFSKGHTSRLDHALVSRGISVESAEYVASQCGYRFAGPEPGCMSDHAALLLDVALRAAPEGDTADCGHDAPSIPAKDSKSSEALQP